MFVFVCMRLCRYVVCHVLCLPPPLGLHSSRNHMTTHRTTHCTTHITSTRTSPPHPPHTQDLWNARGVSYSIPQYSLLYSEEQAIAMMLQTCTNPWAVTSTADVHGLYCRQLGQVCVCGGVHDGA